MEAVEYEGYLLCILWTNALEGTPEGVEALCLGFSRSIILELEPVSAVNNIINFLDSSSIQFSELSPN